MLLFHIYSTVTTFHVSILFLAGFYDGRTSAPLGSSRQGHDEIIVCNV